MGAYRRSELGNLVNHTYEIEIFSFFTQMSAIGLKLPSPVYWSPLNIKEHSLLLWLKSEAGVHKYETVSEVS